MGLFRKVTSLTTLGLVDYRSDGERQARYARQTRNAARAQVAQQAAMLEVQRRQAHHVEGHRRDDALRAMPAFPPPQPIAPPMVAPPGWYDDGRGAIRWFDGYVWTPHTQRALPR